jgi:hypothetical protein
MIEVLTHQGFKQFDAILDQGLSSSLLHIVCNNSGIKCTKDHQFLLEDGLTYIPAQFLEIGDILYPSNEIINITEIENENVYDLLNVRDTHSYYANGLVNHNCLYLDEFGFVDNANTFYTGVYPVVTSGKDTKVIITSTANGVGNMFYKLWEGAVQKTNEFVPFTIKWSDVPGRDEAWKKQTISNTSELQFQQEYGCEFLGSNVTLISSSTLLGLQSIPPLKTQYSIKYYAEPIAGHDYILTADVSKGRGQDYSTFTVIDISCDGTFKQVCTYRDNLISPLLFPELIVRAAKVYNNALVIIENNDAGMVVCNSVYYDYEYDNTFVESSTRSNGIGVTMTKRVKRIGCSNLKDLIENGKLELVDDDSIIELSTFEPKGDSFAASGGSHDDMVMNLVLFSWFVSTSAFGGMSNVDIKELMYAEKLREMEEDVVPFGIISTGETYEKTQGQISYEAQVAALEEWGNL